jgi:shikimate kinase
MTDAGACRVVLLGMMGSGKTTLGRLLSRRTGWPYHDNDLLLAEATGQTARKLAASGTAALREAEASALRHALMLPPPVIVSVAAGVVTDQALRMLLRRAGIVVWLRAPAEVLAERAVMGTHRPWLEADAAAWIAATIAEREALYGEVADVAIDTAEQPPAETAERVLTQLAATACRRWLDTPLATSGST